MKAKIYSWQLTVTVHNCDGGIGGGELDKFL